MAGMMAGTGRSLLVNLLLDIVEAGLQVQRGQQLPAQQVWIVPADLGGQGQAVGQQHGIRWLVEPAAQGRLVVQALLLDERVLFAGDVQHLGQLFALFEQQAIALMTHSGSRQCSARLRQSCIRRTPNSACSTSAASSPLWITRNSQVSSSLG